MSIFINDEERNIKASNIEELLNEIDMMQEGIALALNEEVITKYNWKDTLLNENDKVLIFTATAGG